MDKVIDFLSKLNIEYELREHEPVYTVEEAESIKDMITGIGCKNLFLKDKSESYFLYVINCNKRADLKMLQKEINCNRLKFASEEELYKYFKVKGGSVSPLGVINDDESRVTIILDSELRGNKLLVHPNINSATISISYDDLIKVINHCGNKILIIKI